MKHNLITKPWITLISMNVVAIAMAGLYIYATIYEKTFPPVPEEIKYLFATVFGGEVAGNLVDGVIKKRNENTKV